MTPELTEAIAEALEARELIKISVLKNCADDPRELAETACRAYTLPGCSGDRQEDRSLQRRKR